MARLFSGTNHQINSTAYSAHKGVSRLTLAGWIRRDSSGSIQNLGWNESVNNRFVITWFSDNRVYCTQENGNNSFPSVLQNVTGWHHVAFVFDGSLTTPFPRVRCYVNGTLQTLTAGGANPAATISTNAAMDTFRIGRALANSAWSTGGFAEVAAWTEALSADDCNALAKGFAPSRVRPQHLMLYLPLLRDVLDPVRAASLTTENTTVINHPRLYL